MSPGLEADLLSSSEIELEGADTAGGSLYETISQSALPRAYSRLHDAIEATSLGVWEWDVARGEVFWSPRQRVIFGVGPEERADYALWASRLHPEDSASVQEQVRRLLDPSSGGEMHIQHRLLLPSGEVRWIESHGKMLYQDGAAVRLLGTVTDITFRKRSEDDLKNALASLEVALDAADAVPWQYHTATRDLKWSPRVSRLMRIAPGRMHPSMDEFLNRVHPEQQHLLKALRAEEAVARPGTKFTLQLHMDKGDGSWMWLERRSIVGEEEGNGRWIYGVDLDITQRKEAEDELARMVGSLAKERERLAIALTVGRLGVYEWQVGREDIWWSPELYPLYGVDAETFTPTLENFTALIHPDDREELWCRSEECIRERKIFEHAFRILTPSGAQRWILNRSHVGLNPQGEVERLIGVAADITERKAREEQVYLLMHEVNHRSKNLLAVVQAIASQSAKTDDPAVFARHFAVRLQGLAASHDLILRNSGNGASLADLVASQLSHLSGLLGKRIMVKGPNCY